MITEKDLVRRHGSFWRGLLPMSGQYLRYQSQMLRRAFEPLESADEAASRGLVNEYAFRLFSASVKAKVPNERLSSAARSSALASAMDHIHTMRRYGRDTVQPLGSVEHEVAAELATRMGLFFYGKYAGRFGLRPRFAGCGILEECEGDLLVDGCLYEIKAGKRMPRSEDIRQLLVYCALNFCSNQHEIGRVGLFNPRMGYWFDGSVDAICQLMAGKNAADVLGEIVTYVCSAGIRPAVVGV